MKLSILVPAYNEENTIQNILESLINVHLVNGVEKEIIVVNDASRDKTAEKIETDKNEKKNKRCRDFRAFRHLSFSPGISSFFGCRRFRLFPFGKPLQIDGITVFFHP